MKVSVYSIDSVINFGKFKGKSVKALIDAVEGRQYLNWVIENGIIELDENASYTLKVNDSEIMACNSYNFIKVYTMNDVINFGKYKGETIDSLFGRDDSRAYLRWLVRNHIICLDFDCQERLNSYLLGDGDVHSHSKEYFGWDDEGLACGVLECDCY